MSDRQLSKEEHKTLWKVAFGMVRVDWSMRNAAGEAYMVCSVGDDNVTEIANRLLDWDLLVYWGGTNLRLTTEGKALL